MYDIYQGHKITGQFGEDRKTHKHKGVDIAYPMNADLLAMLGGKVGNIGDDPSGYGKYIDIISDGGLTERYAHANDFDVKIGDLIKEGQKIGRVGSTGRSTGPHIHTEFIKDGRNINPMDVLKNPNKYLKQVIGTPQKQDITAPALAMAQALQQPQEQSQTQPNPLDERVQNILMESLKNVEAPQQPTTIEDIFNAKSGNRLNTLLSYINSPQGAEAINAVAGLINPKLGGNYGFAKNVADDRYAQLANEQETAQDLFKELGIDKRFGKEIGLKTEQFGFEKEKFKTEADYKKARDKVEDAFKTRELSQKDYEIQTKDLEAKARKDLSDAQIKKINTEMSGTDKKTQQQQKNLMQLNERMLNLKRLIDDPDMPHPISGTTGLVHSAIRNVYRPNKVEAQYNTAIQQLKLLIPTILDDTGKRISNTEIIAIESSLPKLNDTYENKKAKFDYLYQQLEDKYNINKGTMTSIPGQNKASSSGVKIKSIKEIK
jgi:hypothetical protein